MLAALLHTLVLVPLRALAGFAILYALFISCWFWLHRSALVYAVKNRDAKWSAGPSPPAPTDTRRERKVIFVRHGESTWNETFNKSKNPVFFIPRLIKAAVKESIMLAQNVQDSWFLDAPLSELGFAQATELRAFLAKGLKTNDEFAALMLGKAGRSTVVSSNLRRAISTCVAALWDRLQNDGQEVLLLSDLQEISHNPDTLAITPAYERPVPSWVDREFTGVDMAKALVTKISPSFHHGSKDITSNGQTRMLKFCDWVFAEDRGTLIVFGHSLFFRSFFKEFMPRTVAHDAKAKKMVNCGAVGFTLQAMEIPGRGTVFRVDDKSIKNHYGGYTSK